MFWAAFKIPPISERSTASNISFEQEGALNVPESWIGLPNLSFASHGVRSRPMSTVLKNPPNTIPLLSQTMEKNLIKENYIINGTTNHQSTTNEKNTTIFSTWEENYQDLSDWCIDTFIRDQSDFLVGESISTNYTGTKNEDKNVSMKLGCIEASQEGNRAITKGGILCGEREGSQVNNNQLIQRFKEEKDEKTTYVPDGWLDLPKSSIALRTDEWIKQIDSEVEDEIIKREDWDVNKFDNESDSFDLLSYLCNDDMISPEENPSTSNINASTINTERRSTRMSSRANGKSEKRKSPISSVVSSPQNIEDDSNSMQLTNEASSSWKSASSTSSLTTKERQRNVIKIETKTSRSTKRSRESDNESDEEMSDCSSSYRDSREKNNEASRKSRMNKKVKETEMMKKATILEKDNKTLKRKVEKLEKMVTSMRAAILRSALRRNVSC